MAAVIEEKLKAQFLGKRVRSFATVGEVVGVRGTLLDVREGDNVYPVYYEKRNHNRIGART